MNTMNRDKILENNSSRLASLDILRGFDLFLLVFFQPVFVALGQQLDLPFLNRLVYLGSCNAAFFVYDRGFDAFFFV